MTPLEKPVGKPIGCEECRGTGYAEPAPGFTFGNDCPVCRGKGWLSEPARIAMDQHALAASAVGLLTDDQLDDLRLDLEAAETSTSNEVLAIAVEEEIIARYLARMEAAGPVYEQRPPRRVE